MCSDPVSSPASMSDKYTYLKPTLTEIRGEVLDFTHGCKVFKGKYERSNNASSDLKFFRF